MPEVSDFGPIAKSRQEVVSWLGYELYVPPLELQLLVNERRGQVERTEKIRQFVGRWFITSMYRNYKGTHE